MVEWYFTTYLIYPAILMVHDNYADDNDTNNADDNSDDADSF